MCKLSEAQRQWVEKFFGLDGGGGATSKQVDIKRFGPDYVRADSDDIPTVRPAVLPWLPGVDDLDLPDSKETDDLVTIIVRESGEKLTMQRPYVLSMDYYVDNAAQKMTARATTLHLVVKTMQFASPLGTFSVNMNDIMLGPRFPAKSFEMKGRFIYPLDSAGDVLFDTLNTPRIVRLTEWLLKEIERRRAERLEITSAGFMFMISFAQLGAAVGPPSLPKGVPPTSMKPPPKLPAKPSGGGSPPTTTIHSSPPPIPKPPAKPTAGGPPKSTIVESPPPVPRAKPVPKRSTAKPGGGSGKPGGDPQKPSSDIGNASTPAVPPPVQPPKSPIGGRGTVESEPPLKPGEMSKSQIEAENARVAGYRTPRAKPSPGDGQKVTVDQALAELGKKNGKVIESGSHTFHRQIWQEYMRMKGEPPIAFKYSGRIRIDIEKLTPAERQQWIALDKAQAEAMKK